jgi:hypothetical protein
MAESAKSKSTNPIIAAATRRAESTAAIEPMAMPAGMPRKTLKPAEEDDPTGSLGQRRPVPIPPDAKWISALQVRARYGGRSHMWLERKLKNDPNFPKPTYFGPLRYWQPVALDAYEEAIIQQQLSGGKPSRRSGGFAASA